MGNDTRQTDRIDALEQEVARLEDTARELRQVADVLLERVEQVAA
jgi:hypothetical protein